MAAGQNAPTSLADRLDRLFRTVRPAGRAEYSHEEVASAIRAQGVSISHTYVWQLRRGLRDNPTIKHLEALAKFFGVRPSYFLDEDTSEIDAQLELLATLRNRSVRALALRANGLSAAGLQAVAGMIEHARAVEGLPPADDERQPPGD
ncbi:MULTISPECIES: helix-turn-helix domain-containing protein [Amycolatopsis]|uniref:XRE family transcriptional regulator n=1 Tax=Amycolatopsis bullii TaxID=941987 RepID=A0ABQ3JX83_9PSEU|nr:helix-turn-helix domain-containing protein [Amycolatopsis bullii]GHF94138.1 XRE family transcriptional regulator [Amycolatopsis bullii]